MAHEIESLFFVGPTPWHGLGIELKAPPTAEEAIIASGLDWAVATKPVFAQFDGKVIEAPEHRAVVRDRDDRVLGIVGRKYTPLQNRQAFDWFDPVIQTGQASYHTAGSLRDGQIVWVLAQVDGVIEVGGEDVVEKYLLLTNSHDGSRNVQALYTPIRVVCANTLRVAIDGCQTAFRFRHTTSIAERLVEAQKALGIVNDQFGKLGESYRQLARTQVAREKIAEYLLKVFPPNPQAKSDAQKQVVRARVIDLFGGAGRGADLATARGTAWGLYNAVTEYVDHERGLKDQAGAKVIPIGRAAGRLESVWLGDGAKVKERAFIEAVRLAA